MEAKKPVADERTIRRNVELWRRSRQEQERRRQTAIDRQFFVEQFNSIKEALKGGNHAQR